MICFVKFKWSLLAALLIRVADSHHFIADPNPAFHSNADTDLAFHFNADPDPASH
jgi:hypothetical protein